MMTYIQWVNTQTREAYFDFLECVEDPLAYARQWLDMGSADARQLLARRLKKDAEGWCRIVDDPFQRSLMRLGLRRVCWVQVAGRILERAQPIEETASQEGDAAGAA